MLTVFSEKALYIIFAVYAGNKGIKYDETLM